MGEKTPLEEFHSRTRIASAVAAGVIAAGFASFLVLAVVGVASVLSWAF